MSNVYIDVHVIQDLPPSNINRDDNGTPKQAVFGGVERLRVSSQSWKRATRGHFADRMEQDELGVRTRRLHGLLSGLLVERGLSSEEATERASAALGRIKITMDKRAKADGPVQTSYLVFAGRAQLNALADALVEPHVDPGNVPVEQILGNTHPLDVALFGRMVADLTDLNVDAAAQVAHAISTHAAPTQFDYFTAVDDMQDKDEAGAGMIGTVEFNAATLYRFATVGLEQLVDNMGDRDAAISGVAQFVDSFVSSMPSGKQNSFAARTRPALVAVVIREDQPVSMVGAFETPVVRGKDGGLTEPSLRRLGEYSSGEQQRWGDTPRLVAASYAAAGTHVEAVAAAFGPSLPFGELLSAVTSSLHGIGNGDG